MLLKKRVSGYTSSGHALVAMNQYMRATLTLSTASTTLALPACTATVLIVVVDGGISDRSIDSGRLAAIPAS